MRKYEQIAIEVTGDNYHGAAPNAAQYEVAMYDLNKVLSGLEAE